MKTKISLFLILIFLLSRNYVRAQHWGLSLWPPLLEATIKPGKSFTQAYWLINPSPQDLYLTPVIVPFRPQGEQGQLRPLSLNSTSESQKFFRLTNSRIQLGKPFKIAANSRQQLVLKVAPPADQPEGDYYYLFLFKQTRTGQFLSNSGGQSLIHLGSPILISLSQSDRPLQQGNISQFQAQPKWAKSGRQPIQLRLVVANVGPHFFKPQGKIEIRYWGRWLKAEQQLRPDNVLTKSRRLIGCLKEDQAQPCQFRSWWPGYYQAQVELHPDRQPDLKLKATTSFFILPLEPLVVLLAILLLIQLKSNLTKIIPKMNNN